MGTWSYRAVYLVPILWCRRGADGWPGGSVLSYWPVLPLTVLERCHGNLHAGASVLYWSPEVLGGSVDAAQRGEGFFTQSKYSPALPLYFAVSLPWAELYPISLAKAHCSGRAMTHLVVSETARHSPLNLFIPFSLFLNAWPLFLSAGIEQNVNIVQPLILTLALILLLF